MAQKIRAILSNLQRELQYWQDLGDSYQVETLKQRLDHWRRELALAEGFRGGHTQCCG